MSIIADALRKAETSPAGSPQPPSPGSLWAYRLMLMVCVGMVLGGLWWMARHPGKGPSSPTPTTAQGRSEPAPQKSSGGLKLLRSAEGELSLSGIVQGGGGRPLALINNQVVEEGDQIRGKRVVRVEANTVQLQDDSGRIKTLKLGD